VGIVTYLAEGVSSVTYTTSKMGHIATGFNLTIVDEAKNTHDGEIEVSVTGDREFTAKLGSTHGIVLSDGKSIARTKIGKTTVVVDPILDLLKKAIIVNDNRSYLEEKMGGQIESSDFLVILTPAKIMEANAALASGDVLTFIDTMFGLRGGAGNGVVIKTDKAKESPIIRDLDKLRNTASGTESAQGSFFVSNAHFTKHGLYTVENIFTQTLGPLGLELYWSKDNVYSLEPPRLTNPNAEVKPIDIGQEDIIRMNVISDPYNIPDIILPQTMVPNVLGAGGITTAAKIALETGILSNMENKRSMKIQTYTIPNFLHDTIKIAMNTGKNSIDKDSAPIENITSPDAIKSAITFFGSHARKSKLYGLTRGTCSLIFRPEITEPACWYNIDGKEMFVSSIAHNITRGNATTTLTIAGIRNVGHETQDIPSSAEGVGQIIEVENAFVKDVKNNTAKEETAILKSIQQDAKSAQDGSVDEHGCISFWGGDLSKEEASLIFGDKDEIAEAIEKAKEINKLIGG